MSIETVNKPDWYGEPDNAWFPTEHACGEFMIPSFEGYMSLYDAFKKYPETNIDCWEILPVSGVENPTIYFP